MSDRRRTISGMWDLMPKRVQRLLVTGLAVAGLTLAIASPARYGEATSWLACQWERHELPKATAEVRQDFAPLGVPVATPVSPSC